MATSNNTISGIINIEYFKDKYITFGKYKGKSYKYIYKNDKSYCNWLCGNIKSPNRDMEDFFIFIDLENKEIKHNDYKDYCLKLKMRIKRRNLDYPMNKYEMEKYQPVSRGIKYNKYGEIDINDFIHSNHECLKH